jgi:UDPglucose 6-dehydrogenase
MYKIAVLGTGYVGITTGIGLANFGSNVLCLDIDTTKIARLKEGELPIYEPGMDEVLKENVKANRLNFSTDIESGIQWADIIFIAVGTPSGADGKADLTAIRTAAQTIGVHLNGYKIIVTKSTVPVGTNELIKTIISENDPNHFEFDVVSNPEFLREGKALYDFLHPDRVVIGTDNPRPIEALRKIYRPLYLNEVPFILTDFRTAELIKYSANCYLAMKVAFINEISRLCDTVGANVQVVANALGRDGRIGGKFLHPGPGFGGSCFPKDTKALASFARELGTPLSLIDITIESNEKQKRYMVEKVKKHFGNLANLKLGILGLSFKSETDDMREASSIVIINELLQEGARVSIFDPQAMENAKRIWGDRVTYGLDEYNTVSGTDAMIILTEWNQFRNLNLEKIAGIMKQKVFFDFRNIYKRVEAETAGFTYIGLGQ